jgi:hypothetical protein
VIARWLSAVWMKDLWVNMDTSYERLSSPKGGFRSSRLGMNARARIRRRIALPEVSLEMTEVVEYGLLTRLRAFVSLLLLTLNSWGLSPPKKKVQPLKKKDIGGTRTWRRQQKQLQSLDWDQRRQTRALPMHRREVGSWWWSACLVQQGIPLHAASRMAHRYI